MVDGAELKYERPSSMGSVVEIARQFEQFLDSKNAFCVHLELAADLLPNAIDPQDCLLLAQKVVPLIRRAHEFEETTVFPVLLANPALPPEFVVTVDRLRFEHLGDEDFADELCISLRGFVMDRPHANVEALAWMLRGFFEGLRRHVAFEREYILPLMTKAGKP
jgi:Hemerythrin HHE cation binding domain